MKLQRTTPTLLLRSCSVGCAAMAAMLAIAVVPAITVPDAAVAQPYGAYGERPRGLRGGGVLEQLNLTQQQQVQLREIREKNRDAMRSKAEELRREQDKLRDLMASSAANGEVESQFGRVQSLRQEMSRLHFSQMLDMRNVLTPSQRAQLDKLMQDRRQGMRQRLRDRMAPPPGNPDLPTSP